MNRRSILHAVPSDRKHVAIGALESFVVSLVDGTSTLEQVADSAGLGADEIVALARHLVDVGALSIDPPKAKSRTRRPAPLRRTEDPSEPPPELPLPEPPKIEPPKIEPPKSLVPPEIAPIALPVADLRSLGISAREGFILSQIDGVTSTGDLIAITHLSPRDVSDALYALEAVGAIEMPHRKDRARPRRPSRTMKAPTVRPTKSSSSSIKAPAARATKSSAKHTKAPSHASMAASPRSSRGASMKPQAPLKAPHGPSSKPPPSVRSSKPPPVTPPPSQKLPRVEKRVSEIPAADRATITEEAARLAALDHYGSLGVARDSDAKAIRRAYHALAAKFHPDRYFGKNLGATREPLQSVFIHITRAYETLSKKATRAEYDATLPSMPIAEPPTPPSNIAPPPIVAPPPSPPIVAPPPPPIVVAPPPPSPPIVVAPPPPPIVVAPPPPPPIVAPPTPPIAPPPASAPMRAAVPSPPPPPPPDSLRRTMPGGKKQVTVQEHVDVFMRAAKDALERSDLVAAANNYRLAAQVSPDPAIRAALEETDAKAKAWVKNTSLTAAHAAEQSGKWSEAAAKYAKAHGAQPTPWIAERAANALRREGADLRRAAQLAEQAVLAEPNNAGFHVTLGEIYLDAGMKARATGESARAVALAPADPRAIALARLIAKTTKS